MTRPSIHQIAKRANVSAVTVSRILNGKIKGSRPATAKRISEIVRIADELGYRPHMAARSMANGRFNSIGMIRGIEDSKSHDFGGKLTWKIQQSFGKRGFNVLIGTMDDRQLDDVAYVPQMLRELSSDGLVINYTHRLPPHLSTVIDESRLPVVWPNSKRTHDSVYPDDASAGRRASELLLRLGHRRIAFLVTVDSLVGEPHYSKADRKHAYELAMQAAGLAGQVVVLDAEPKAAATRLIELLRSADRPTAFVTYSFIEGGTAMMAANRIGMRVPDELSIVTIGSYEPSVTGLSMTMLEIPVLEMGDATADMLIERLANPTVSIPSRALPFSLSDGGTVAPPPPAGGP